MVLYLTPIPLWIAAWASGAYVGRLTLIGMRFRRVPPSTVVTARISAVKAGLDISINDLEAHYLAGGNVVRVVNALISADKANIAMPFKRAAAIDLAGRDVLEAVKMSVIPRSSRPRASRQSPRTASSSSPCPASPSARTSTAWGAGPARRPSSRVWARAW
jgi:uncharacterized protein YqfA (UPF0365 family)